MAEDTLGEFLQQVADAINKNKVNSELPDIQVSASDFGVAGSGNNAAGTLNANTLATSTNFAVPAPAAGTTPPPAGGSNGVAAAVGAGAPVLATTVGPRVLGGKKDPTPPTPTPTPPRPDRITKNMDAAKDIYEPRVADVGIARDNANAIASNAQSQFTRVNTDAANYATNSQKIVQISREQSIANSNITNLTAQNEQYQKLLQQVPDQTVTWKEWAKNVESSGLPDSKVLESFKGNEVGATKYLTARGKSLQSEIDAQQKVIDANNKNLGLLDAQNTNLETRYQGKGGIDKALADSNQRFDVATDKQAEAAADYSRVSGEANSEFKKAGSADRTLNAEAEATYKAELATRKAEAATTKSVATDKKYNDSLHSKGTIEEVEGLFGFAASIVGMGYSVFNMAKNGKASAGMAVLGGLTVLTLYGSLQKTVDGIIKNSQTIHLAADGTTIESVHDSLSIIGESETGWTKNSYDDFSGIPLPGTTPKNGLDAAGNVKKWDLNNFKASHTELTTKGKVLKFLASKKGALIIATIVIALAAYLGSQRQGNALERKFNMPTIWGAAFGVGMGALAIHSNTDLMTKYGLMDTNVDAPVTTVVSASGMTGALATSGLTNMTPDGTGTTPVTVDSSFNMFSPVYTYHSGTSPDKIMMVKDMGKGSTKDRVLTVASTDLVVAPAKPGDLFMEMSDAQGNPNPKFFQCIEDSNGYARGSVGLNSNAALQKGNQACKKL